MDRESVMKLHRLFETRADIGNAMDYADDKNFWLGIVNEAFKGTGTRSRVMNASGGVGDLAEVLMRSVMEHLNGKVVDADEEIRKMGGEP